jgi:hypothetical protein
VVNARRIDLREKHDPGVQVTEEAKLVKMLEERERERERQEWRLIVLASLVFFFPFFSGHCCLSCLCTRELSGLCC